MTMNLIKKNITVLVVGLMLFLASCQQPGGNNPGSEYMPDMAHSVAYESNHYNYYYNNTWSTEAEYYEMAKPRQPVKGTVARGMAGDASGQIADGTMSHNAIAHAAGGSVPYYYGDTDEERLRATNEIIRNPYPITTEGMARGKDLYNIFCGICHGEKIDGLGYLVRDDGGKYLAAPANLASDEFIAASNGRYYHAIIYGKNVMGGYADKLSYEERWQVIHYIRSIQAKNQKLVYSEEENTFNGDIPGASIAKAKLVNHTDEHSIDDHHGDIHHTESSHMDGDDHHGHEEGSHESDHTHGDDSNHEHDHDNNDDHK